MVLRETQDKEKDKAAAQQAWQVAQKLLNDEHYDMLVFDEMSYMFKYGYLDVEPVVDAQTNALKIKPHYYRSYHGATVTRHCRYDFGGTR